ncbi:hypothetical protein T05_15117 [Trichinella murrelli]|uniref:Uncharacterized protein n=1 Tax=Trichinella murrelli TaxID=144512 RepID=A0A0V0TU46_9BILA|nr:hypothetical protein T05_15117 [Trichinella murrelli]
MKEIRKYHADEQPNKNNAHNAKMLNATKCSYLVVKTTRQEAEVLAQLALTARWIFLITLSN